GDHLLRRRQGDRRGLPRTRRGDGGHQRLRPSRAAPSRRARLVTTPTPRVGVLALQGDVREHVRVLTDLGAAVTPGRRPAELAAVDGLVLPGGESSVIDKLARAFGMREPVRDAIAAGMPVYGTCAGLILLAERIIDGIQGQQTFGGLDVTVRRNAFGSQ